MKKLSFLRPLKGRLYGFSRNQKMRETSSCCLIALECGFLTYEQLESARLAIRKVYKKLKEKDKEKVTGFQIWRRVSVFKPRMRKPHEVRMGKGKGTKVRDWVRPVKKGRMIFEIIGSLELIAIKALRCGQYKLPIKTLIRNPSKLFAEYFDISAAKVCMRKK